ncbi:MAG: N,N'-diacetylchitobiose phosphorylase [Clostridiales bacterium]|nr:N,N'-diacetylchitobiose phosphorylase [Clostridiales bacterium]
MQYGYFDENAREYVITNPNTPMPWANYLGSPAYGAIVTQNAGGYSFVKSGAAGRILRYTFNQFDEPGRYVYLRDEANGDFWSASWRPVEKPLEKYNTQCHHGTAYTQIVSEYEGIKSETLYYVPLGATHEIWRVKVKNTSDRTRKLSVFSYCEFTTDSFYEQDLVNMQYSQFITRTEFMGDHILQHINENCHVDENGENGSERFFGMAGSKVVSYTGRRERFLGRNRFDKPQGVANGKLDDSLNFNGNPCGALHTVIELAAGEEKTIAFVLAQRGKSGARELMDKYTDVEAATQSEFETLRSYWHKELANLVVSTPSDEFNSMVNTWNAFQCFITFVWSRAASLFYCGQRNGYGYRDTVQDIQGIIHLDPAMAKERITFMLSAQVHHGAGLPLVKYTHNPGHEDTPEQESYVKETGHPHYRADDALWLFPTVYKYIAETGDTAYLSEVIPYCDYDEGTVFDHLKRAIDFSMNHLGAHGMPAGLHADWNDCLRLGAQGESSFVAFQLYYALQIMMELTPAGDDHDYFEKIAGELLANINEHFWEDDRFRRGYSEDGQIIGSKANIEGSMWLNPQSWSVISGAATQEQAEHAMQTAFELLNTENGIELMTPCYKKHAFDGAAMILFNATTKENGGIFCQPQGWAILAEARMGHGDRAFQYFIESCPAAYNDRADLREAEPYVHTQFIEGHETPQPGRAHVHWLTGTASTVMVGCVEGILGLRPTPEGILISPSIPSEWDGFAMEKVFRGKKLHITVDNASHSQGGAKQVLLNGEAQADCFIKATDLKDENEVLVVL